MSVSKGLALPSRHQPFVIGLMLELKLSGIPELDVRCRFWSYEVAEHIHPKYTEAFLQTLTSHGPVVVMSAAQPGQGGYGHFNEQPRQYWIERLERRGFSYLADISTHFQSLPDDYARNVLVFVRQSTV